MIMFAGMPVMNAPYESPRDVLARWNALVNAADREGVLSLYSEEAVLLPTFSDTNRTSGAAIGSYFDGLTGFDGINVQVHEDSLVSQPIEGSVYCLSGMYRWEWTRDNRRTRVEARFSYVIDISREAPILHHHSSIVPDVP